MATYIDRRLRDQIDSGDGTGEVEAILVVKEPGEANLSSDDGGLARLVIEGTVERTGDHPIALRYFPRANAVVISAKGRFIREILRDENLAVATSINIDLLDFIVS